jgi:hypothetical protein
MSAHEKKQEKGWHGPAAPRGAALKSYVSEVMAVLEKLERSVQSLPRVNEKGGSDCPKAENLFAEKEELESKLSAAAPTLRAYLAALQWEVGRCQGNLEKIRAGGGSVVTPGAIDALDEAAQAAEDAVYHATTDRDSVMLVLPRVEAVLKVSRSHKYPGQEPKRKSLPRDSTRPGVSSDGPVLTRELEDVLSLGPLRRNR